MSVCVYIDMKKGIKSTEMIYFQDVSAIRP